LAGNPGPSRELAKRLFVYALAREPASEELALAQELLGKSARKEGTEDFLWSLVMLPEFQLIY
jgi:hypothetical protein